MKVGFWTFEKVANRPPNSCGSSRIRGRWVWKYWDEADEAQIGVKYDAIIFQKAFWPQMILESDGFIKIFDECDPSWLETGDAFEYYNACDAVTTSSDMLREYIQAMLPDKPVYHVPDRIDFEEHKTVKKTHEEKLKSVAWFGYSHNFVYLRGAISVLKKAGISLTIYSDTGIAKAAEFDGMELIWKKYHYESLHEDLIKHDALILPSERGGTDVRGRFKSNNKVLTGWALGLPVIESPEDLERLMGVEERVKEANEKLEKVRKEYDVKLSVKQYKQIIKDIQENNRK